MQRPDAAAIQKKNDAKLMQKFKDDKQMQADIQKGTKGLGIKAFTQQKAWILKPPPGGIGGMLGGLVQGMLTGYGVGVFTVFVVGGVTFAVTGAFAIPVAAVIWGGGLGGLWGGMFGAQAGAPGKDFGQGAAMAAEHPGPILGAWAEAS